MNAMMATIFTAAQLIDCPKNLRQKIRIYYLFNTLQARETKCKHKLN